MADPWTDDQYMQQIQDEITEYASTFKPVRSITPVERNGEKLLSLIFEDGQPIAGAGEFNRFHITARQWPVAISLDTD